MAIYCIGDIQGCNDALERLFTHIDFSASRDTAYLLGDLVNRGPSSAAVLRRCLQLGDSVRPVLGNHDLHLLAAAEGVRTPSRRDTLLDVLQAHDRPALLDWLRQQPLVRSHAFGDERLVMVHAGFFSDWSGDQALTLADEVTQVLRSPDMPDFLRAMYGNQPAQWSANLQGNDRLRAIVNACTRMRFCSTEGVMDFDSSESVDAAPEGLVPWFNVPGRRTSQEVVAFGHWSTLGWLNRPDVLGLDTGCVWGGCLSAVRLGPTLTDRELLQVHCPQAQVPGQ